MKSSKDCFSADPSDCLIWCLVEKPSDFRTLTIVTNSTEIEDFRFTEINSEILVFKGGFTAEVNTICPEEITTNIVHSIQKALKARGYYNGELSEGLNSETRSVIERFQKDFRLPIGQLDAQTILSL